MEALHPTQSAIDLPWLSVPVRGRPPKAVCATHHTRGCLGHVAQRRCSTRPHLSDVSSFSSGHAAVTRLRPSTLTARHRLTFSVCIRGQCRTTASRASAVTRLHRRRFTWARDGQPRAKACAEASGCGIADSAATDASSGRRHAFSAGATSGRMGEWSCGCCGHTHVLCVRARTSVRCLCFRSIGS